MTPQGQGRFQRLESLAEVFRVLRMPVENRRTVEAYTAAIGIDHYEQTTGYVIASRQDGGPQIRIAYGWANGFRDREEIEAIVGTQLSTWGSDDRSPLWGLWHPKNRARTSPGSSKTPKRRTRDRRAAGRDVAKQLAVRGSLGCYGPGTLGAPCDEPATGVANSLDLCQRHLVSVRLQERTAALLE